MTLLPDETERVRIDDCVDRGQSRPRPCASSAVECSPMPSIPHPGFGTVFASNFSPSGCPHDPGVTGSSKEGWRRSGWKEHATKSISSATMAARFRQSCKATTGISSTVSMSAAFACLRRLKRSSSAKASTLLPRTIQTADSWNVIQYPFIWARPGAAGHLKKFCDTPHEIVNKQRLSWQALRVPLTESSSPGEPLRYYR